MRVHFRSKLHPQPELHHARLRKERRGRNLAECKCSKCSARHLEGRRIRQVESLCPELEFIFLAYREILEGREVYVEDTTARNIGQCSGDSAIREWRGR